MTHATDVGARIRALRKARGLKQVEVAVSVGLERASLSMIETGADRPGLATLQALADYFGTTLDYLQRGTAPGNPVEGGRLVQDPDQLALLALLDTIDPDDMLALARIARAMAAAAAARKTLQTDTVAHEASPAENI